MKGTGGGSILGNQPTNGSDQENKMDFKTQWDVFATWARARFGDSEMGASLVEYALLLALIAVLCIAGLRILGNSANNKLSQAGSAIQ